MGGESSSFSHENHAVDHNREDAHGTLQALNQQDSSANDNFGTDGETSSDDGELFADRNRPDNIVSNESEDANNSTELRRRHLPPNAHDTEIAASERGINRLDDAWSLFSRIKTTLTQFGARRSPTIYDDSKAASSTTSHNNSELYSGVNKLYSDGLTPLTKAIRSGIVQEVEALLQHPDVDINLREVVPHRPGSTLRDADKTPLIVAINSGQIDMVKLLLEAGADVDATDGNQYSALYYAVNENNSDIMKVLLEYRPTLESPNSYQDPLYTACRYGKTEIVNMLLSAGCAVNRATDIDQPSVLIAAMESTSSEALCLQLIQNGAKLVTGNETTEPLIVACQYGYPSIVQACIDAGCDVNMKLTNGASPLFRAIKLCNFLKDQHTLYGSSTTRSHEFPMDVKDLFLKKMTIVELLCNNGCGLDEAVDNGPDCSSALAEAINLGNLPCAYILLKHGATWNKNCHQNLVNAQKTLTKDLSHNSHIHKVRVMFIPKIVQMLNHAERADFVRETTAQNTVPSLKDCCRHEIRRNLKQSNTSILPLISVLNLPNLLQDYLCYGDLEDMSIFNK